MNKLLFNVVTFLGANSMRAIGTLCNLLSSAIEHIGGWSIKLIAVVSYQLMQKLDPEQMRMMAQLTAAQEQPDIIGMQQTELRLLGAANSVKEHAETTGDWTDQHSEAIEAISNALLNECSWEEDDIHGYMKRLVESIDGLEYGTEH